MLSWNFDNEETLAHKGLSCQEGKKTVVRDSKNEKLSQPQTSSCSKYQICETR